MALLWPPRTTALAHRGARALHGGEMLTPALAPPSVSVPTGAAGPGRQDRGPGAAT